MQPDAADMADVTGHGAPGGTALSPGEELETESERKAEEMRMLLLGFGTGLTIAFVFLLYVVLAYGKLFP
ncbi:MAG TPA: hypothetical protein VKX16_13175 [Chloroflexota bacterium]|nr:hypothetical protein [Chloroflexota bacterium]